jgi:hypothetical protein
MNLFIKRSDPGVAGAAGPKYDLLDEKKERILSFGDSRYSDFTLHKDEKRKELYINRHKKNERWNKSGIYTAGFWSRFLLWNKDALQASINDIKKRFNINVKLL